MFRIFKRKISTEQQLLRKLDLKAFPRFELDEKSIRRLRKLLPHITLGLSIELERKYPSFGEITAEREIEDFEKPEFCMSLADMEKSKPPREPGIYGWYFDKLPPKVPHRKCIRISGRRLLYIGITETDLSNRILSQHFKGNAEGSTLRRKLGCLLRKKLGLKLQKNGKRLTFGEGEAKLSRWMAKHARVYYWVSNRPAQLERIAILRYSPPLNADYNNTHPFYPRLKKIIDACKLKAVSDLSE